MKLLNKMNLIYGLVSLVLFIVLGVLYFLAIKKNLSAEIDEKLYFTTLSLEKKITEGKMPNSIEPYISVSKIENSGTKALFTDTLILDEDNEYEMFRQYSVLKNIEGISYKIIVRESLVDNEDLLGSIISIILTGLIFGLLILLAINRWVSKSVWKPFYKNLEKLKSFSISDKVNFKPEKTEIKEFTELGKELEFLTERLQKDYLTLKKFTEDASHEIQTPIAIIKSKANALLEENKLTESQAEKIKSISISLNKLSKLNQQLLFLTKIENHQFSKNDKVSFEGILNPLVEEFSDIIKIKNIELSQNFVSDWEISSSNALIERLLSILLNNAVMHVPEKGEILIDLKNGELTVSNTGLEPIKNPNRIFDRFYKESGKGSSGLGLAIAKQICESEGLGIKYLHNKNFHEFIVTEL
jgi:signal transduction histidine kinase